MRGINGFRPYTPAEIEGLKAIYRDRGGKGVSAYARSIGRTPQAVHMMARGLGLVTNTGRARKRWTADLERKAIAMRERGATIGEIAAAVGFSDCSVGDKLRTVRQLRKRTCLGCGTIFWSEWPGNRQCRRCHVTGPAASGLPAQYW